MDTTECLFWEPEQVDVCVRQVVVITAHTPHAVRLRHSCQQECAKNNLPGWAQPKAGEEGWLIFRMRGRMAELVCHVPSRPAAEMWLRFKYTGAGNGA